MSGYFLLIILHLNSGQEIFTSVEMKSRAQCAYAANDLARNLAKDKQVYAYSMKCVPKRQTY
jgi:hypothetical protein